MRPTFPALAVLILTLLTALPAAAAAGVFPAAGQGPDTTTVPTDSLDHQEDGEEPYEELEYDGEYEDYQEDSWNLFDLPAWVGLGFSGGFCATGNYESMIGGAISYGKALGETGWLELSVGYTATPLQQSSALQETINDNPGMIFFGAGVRAFLTNPDHPVRYHLLFGMEINFLFWTYDTPINTASDEGGVMNVSDDNLPGIDLHFGVGFTLFRESGLLVTAELVPGVKLWFDETRNGFTNDLFSSYGYMVLKVQAALEIGGE